MILKHIAHIASCEWILTKFNRPNGGEVILIRTILVSIQIFVLAIGLVITLDPDVTLSNILHQLHKYIPWLGAITAGVYTALYARFSSQWTYLAGVYNQIKSAEATSSDTKPSSATDAIYAWKAGFIEDAEELHLATKPLFASIIRNWAQDTGVKTLYIMNTPSGADRLAQLIERVEVVCDKHDHQHRTKDASKIDAEDNPPLVNATPDIFENNKKCRWVFVVIALFWPILLYALLSYRYGSWSPYLWSQIDHVYYVYLALLGTAPILTAKLISKQNGISIEGYLQKEWEEWGQVSHGSNHGNAVGSIFQFIAVVKASRLRVSY